MLELTKVADFGAVRADDRQNPSHTSHADDSGTTPLQKCRGRGAEAGGARSQHGHVPQTHASTKRIIG